MTAPKYILPDSVKTHFAELEEQFPPKRPWKRLELFLIDPSRRLTGKQEVSEFCELLTLIPTRKKPVLTYVANRLRERYHTHRSDSQREQTLNMFESLMYVHAFPFVFRSMIRISDSRVGALLDSDMPKYQDSIRPAAITALESSNFKENSDFYSFSCRVLKNKLFDELRIDIGRTGGKNSGKRRHDLNPVALDDVSNHVRVSTTQTNIPKTSPHHDYSIRSLSSELIHARTTLTERERDVFDLILKSAYDARKKPLTNIEIAESVGVNESRVTQLRKQIQERILAHAPNLVSKANEHEEPVTQKAEISESSLHTQLELAIKTNDFPTELFTRRMLLQQFPSELAANSGIAETQIRLYEKDKAAAVPHQLHKYADALNIAKDDQAGFIERGWKYFDRSWEERPDKVKTLKWMYTLKSIEPFLPDEQQNERLWRAFDTFWDQQIEEAKKASDFPKEILARRMHAHISQEDMAARMGVSVGSIINWESGKKLPTPLKALTVIGQLDVPDPQERQSIERCYWDFFEKAWLDKPDSARSNAWLSELKSYEKELQTLPENDRARAIGHLWQGFDRYWNTQLYKAKLDKNPSLELKARRLLKHLTLEELEKLAGVPRDYIYIRQKYTPDHTKPSYDTAPRSDIAAILDVPPERKPLFNESLRIDTRKIPFGPKPAGFIDLVPQQAPLKPKSGNTVISGNVKDMTWTERLEIKALKTGPDEPSSRKK